MIMLNRTTEYGLVALRHMSRKASSVPSSAREIADSFGFPFEITAKTLQRLRDTGLIQSAQGARGGYTLARPMADITLGEFLGLMEGPQAVVACAGGEEEPSEPCAYKKKCEITHMMGDLNRRVMTFLAGIRLSDLADDPKASPISLSSFNDVPEAMSAKAR